MDRGSEARPATGKWYRLEVEKLRKVGSVPTPGVPIAQTETGEMFTEFKWTKVKK